MTVDTKKGAAASSRPRRLTPGVVVVFTGRRAACRAFALDERRLVIGRDAEGGVTIEDPLMSRRHAEIAICSEGFLIRDLGSRNGTSVNGALVADFAVCAQPPVARFGGTVVLVVPDVLPFAAGLPMEGTDFIVGPTLRTVLSDVAPVAASGYDLLILGESGSGKEMAARHFHPTGPRARGPFIAVNCAAIPAGIAERELPAPVPTPDCESCRPDTSPP